MGLLYDGVDDVVTHGAMSAIDVAAAVTWSWWLFGDGSQSNRTIMRRFAAADTGFRFVPTSLNKMQLVFGAAAGSNIGETGVDSMVPNTWQHWWVVYDGAGATNADRLKAWITGVPQTLGFTNTIPDTALATAAGASFLTGNASTPLLGSLAHLRIWLAARPSAAEAIQEAASYHPVRTENLLLWAPYDDGTAARDYSGNGHHGVVTGALQASGPPISYGAAA